MTAAYAFLLMFTAPFIFGIAAVHTSAGYIISRFLIGWALAAFVTCQFWTSIMFSPNVVGFANALAGGWGNAGQSSLIVNVVHPALSIWQVCPADMRFCYLDLWYEVRLHLLTDTYPVVC